MMLPFYIICIVWCVERKAIQRIEMKQCDIQMYILFYYVPLYLELPKSFFFLSLYLFRFLSLSFSKIFATILRLNRLERRIYVPQMKCLHSSMYICVVTCSSLGTYVMAQVKKKTTTTTDNQTNYMLFIMCIGVGRFRKWNSLYYNEKKSKCIGQSNS